MPVGSSSGYHWSCCLLVQNGSVWCHTSVLRSPIRKHLASAFSILSPVLLTASSSLWRTNHSVTQSTPEHFINFILGWWPVRCSDKRAWALQPHWPATKSHLSHVRVVRAWGNFSETQFTHAKWEITFSIVTSQLMAGLPENLFKCVVCCLASCSYLISPFFL